MTTEITEIVVPQTPYVEYSLSSLGIPEEQLRVGLQFINLAYRYTYYYDESDTIYWHGMADENGIFDPITFPMPSVQDIVDHYNIFLAEQAAIPNQPREVPDRIITQSNQFTFLTCPQGNACVTIPCGSNSVATNLDPSKQENKTLVPNNTYINAVSNLPMYTYNIIGQDPAKLRIAPNAEDWNNVFNFENKDPTKQNIELMDMIGVLLSCVKNLNERISQLENSIP